MRIMIQRGPTREFFVKGARFTRHQHKGKVFRTLAAARKAALRLRRDECESVNVIDVDAEDEFGRWFVSGRILIDSSEVRRAAGC